MSNNWCHVSRLQQLGVCTTAQRFSSGVGCGMEEEEEEEENEEKEGRLWDWEEM